MDYTRDEWTEHHGTIESIVVASAIGGLVGMLNERPEARWSA